MASWNQIIFWENAQGSYQCGKLPNPRKGGELGIVDLSTRGYELHLQNWPLGKKDLLTKLFWRWKMILLNQGYTKDAHPLSHTWCKTSDYFGAREQIISSRIWRRIMRNQNDYLLFNDLPLSLQYMCNFVKDWRSFQWRWVTLGWWLAGIAPSGTQGAQKVLGSNPVMCRWNTCWPSGNEVDLTWGCQLLVRSVVLPKNKSKKGFGLSLVIKASSNMSKVKGCFLGGWYFSMLEDHVMYRSLVW